MSLRVHMQDARAYVDGARVVDLAVDVDIVHDLRVALRRARSLAQGLRVVDPQQAPLWRALSAQAKGLFDGLGALRDRQVMVEHAARLVPGAAVVDVLAADVPALAVSAHAAVVAFDLAAWDALTAQAPPCAERVLRRRVLLEHLAVTRCDEARALHVQAMRVRSAEALHATRIGVKRLRYTLESFLPDVHAEVAKPLKKLQEILGDIHDLDVLRDAVVAGGVDAAAVAAIDADRADRLAAYKALATGRRAVWHTLRAALPSDDTRMHQARRAYLHSVAAAGGVDDRAVLRAERALSRLAAPTLPSVTLQLALPIALVAKRRRRRRLLRGLVGFTPAEKEALRLGAESPAVVGACAFARTVVAM
jgi:CHAD domain-containing protein